MELFFFFWSPFGHHPTIPSSPRVLAAEGRRNPSDDNVDDDDDVITPETCRFVYQEERNQRALDR